MVSTVFVCWQALHVAVSDTTLAIEWDDGRPSVAKPPDNTTSANPGLPRSRPPAETSDSEWPTPDHCRASTGEQV